MAMEIFQRSNDEQVLNTYIDFNTSNPLPDTPSGDSNVSRINQGGAVFNFDRSPPVRVRPELSAKAYMIIDPHTGSSIISYNEHVPLPPASLTKVMTA